MKTKLIMLVAALTGSVLVAGSAGADLIAGWDFSQYRVDGALSINGSTYTDTLAANYSGLDPTNNAGAGSAAFGSFHIDGTNGSTNVDEASASAVVVPTAAVPGSAAITANLTAPATSFGKNPFDSFSILAGEGQSNTQQLGITARGAADVVFRAGQPGVTRSAWNVSFGGRAVSGFSNVDVAFSTNCASYSNVGTVELSEEQEAYRLYFGTVATDVGCVRLSLDPGSGGQPILDNVAVSATVPEPGSTSLLVAGVLGLVGLARRRRI